MTRIALLVAACALALTACGAGSDPAASDGTDAAAGACPVDDPDCVDTPELDSDEPVVIGDEGIEQFRKDAQFYLGVAEAELPETVRVGRIGDEHMALTEDYRVGRITVELDDVDDDGSFEVTAATVELPDGPETFTLNG